MSLETYTRLSFERRPHGVLLIYIDRPESYNAADKQLLKEFVTLWRDIDQDEETKVAVITGRGKAFCAGGDLSEEREKLDNFEAVVTVMNEARGLVRNLIDCSKPIISAINGPAAGAGLAVALLADISIVSESAKLTDGHVNIGLAAGDHSAVIWPLLCGMAKAKDLLLTGDVVDGAEAARMGLVSKAVPRQNVLEVALERADKLAQGPQHAIRWTKYALNHWLRSALPIFDTSLGLELLTFFSDDAKEGIDAFLERRQPIFG
jgi:enoyl-CoA hydratase